MSKKNDELVKSGCIATILSWIFGMPIVILIFAMAFRLQVFELYVPFFVFGVISMLIFPVLVDDFGW